MSIYGSTVGTHRDNFTCSVHYSKFHGSEIDPILRCWVHMKESCAEYAGLEKSGRLVAICDQKLFLATQVMGRGGQVGD